MIDAGIYKRSDGKIVGFVLRGHSGGNERGYGYNVGCAEVSVLSQTVYLGIRKYLNREAAAENSESGGLGVELKYAPDDLTEAVFQIMLIGLRKIEKSKSNVVKVKMIPLDKTAESKLQEKLDAMKPTPSHALPKIPVDKVAISVDILQVDDKTIGFSVEERADNSAAELKIYCAGIWALTKSVAACIEKHLRRDVSIKKNARRLTVKLNDAPDEITEAVFQTMMIGLREIEKQAPQIVNVNEKIFGGEIN
ncbi:MAG: ribosomal-processing cysteine protease Prp [Selenomonadaceae bacterium]|nr:ribosomal-processing cysteine protease Prp [Selenomonadaceae bacterium]